MSLAEVVGELAEAQILIADDQESNLLLLSGILRRAGFGRLTTISDARQIMPRFQELRPDLLLLDLHMPVVDGFAILEQLTPHLPAGEYLPVLVLTADPTPTAKQRALALGAKDFLTKPFDPTEVLLRIRALLTTRLLYRRLQGQNQRLEEQVRARTQALLDAQLETVERLALAAEYRDDATGQHTRRVGRLAARLARALGLPEAAVGLIEQAAPLHDVGKIGVADAILLKPGPLTPAERAAMERHAVIGATILGGSRSPLLRLGEAIALTHHERWDGGGYPAGLAGEAIPLAGRLVAVADTVDALAHARPYKPAWPAAAVTAEIARQHGRQFDPAVVDGFRSLVAGGGGAGEGEAALGLAEPPAEAG